MPRGWCISIIVSVLPRSVSCVYASEMSQYYFSVPWTPDQHCMVAHPGPNDSHIETKILRFSFQIIMNVVLLTWDNISYSSVSV